MRWLVLVGLLLGLGSVAAQDLPELYRPQGTLILTNLTTAPFPHPSRAKGHTYKDRFFTAEEHYSDNSVAIFVPKSYPTTEKVDLLVHFHGWKNQVTAVLQGYKLIDQLTAAGKNVVLVVPQGPKNASDSSGGKLEDPNGFKAFVADVLDVLRSQAMFAGQTVHLGHVILSGHSGGYKVMSAIVDRGGLSDSVSEVWLFDALYAEGDKFLAWQSKTHGRLLNIHTPNGGTRQESLNLMQELKKREIPFLDTNENAVSDEQLKTNRIVFIATDLAHNDVLARHRTFQKFLETSGL